MKSHGVYETPGGTILLYAHRELESLILDRETMHFKEMVAVKYAELTYNGLWFTPLREAIDAFVNSTQGPVTGTVKLKLYKGNIITAGKEISVQFVSRRFRHLRSGGCLRPESRRRFHSPVRSQHESPRDERLACFGSRYAEA
jgi:argininosuccinate synthase